MIIKIACNKELDSWRWYEADHVQKLKRKLAYWKELNGVNSSGEMILNYEGGINEETIFSEETLDNETYVSLISFISAYDKTLNTVYTDMAVYLLNNTGETIEKL